MKSRLPIRRLSTLALSLLLSATVAVGQTTEGIEFSWGDSYQLPRKHEDMGFIGNEQDGYIQIGHRQKKSVSFQRFDNKLHLTGSSKVSLKSLPKSYQHVAFTKVGSKYYWFFATFDRKTRTDRLFAQELDVRGNQVAGSAREICSGLKLVREVDGGVALRGGDDRWHLHYSLDSNKLLIRYRKQPEKNASRNKDVIGFQVFDQNLTRIWGKDIRMPYTEKRMDNEDYHVDREGNVYTLAKVYNEDRGSKKKPNYRMEILKWSPESKEVVKIPFKFSDKFVNTASMAKGPNGDLMVVGYYSNKRFGLSADGVFLLRLDEKTGELTNIRKGTYEFPESVLSEFESARTRRRNERKDNKDDLEATNMQMRDILIGEDGSIYVYGEEYYWYVITTRINNGKFTSTTRTYYFHYNDILAMKIGADGNLDWVTKIPKEQMGINTGRAGMSFKLFPHQDNHYLFFMDNRKNIDLPEDKSPHMHREGRGGELVVVKLDKNGNTKKASVYDVREEHKNLWVTDFNAVGADKMMGRAFHRRKSQPAFITFK